MTYSEKSHVSMGQHLCKICCTVEDSGEIILDKRLEATLDRKTVTGFGICGECQEKIDKGYVALIVIDPERSKIGVDGRITPENAHRLGQMAWLKRKVGDDIFGESFGTTDLVFIDSEVFAALSNMADKSA